ncbi:MFS family permease [Prauserella sediminis]|uniref:MFS family permease n=1 Tax=Prauserella sediminis TaxID=577680 RepID=A0A839Y2H5_9PSEU|nr:MFS transporter [Prauserella sediminis]MBB3666115.1 MFS family permease [Prauserella sediminis]
MTTTDAPPADPEVGIAALWPLYLGSFFSTSLMALSNTVAPATQAALGATDSELALATAALGAAFASGLVFAGRLGDRIGRRLLFRSGIASIAVACVLVAFAPSVPVLVAARFVLGAAAAVTLPQVLATIQHTFDGAARARAIGWYGASSGFGTIGGLATGGVLVDALGTAGGWRASFLAFAVFAGLGWFGSRRVPETRSNAPGTLDHTGTVLLAVGLFTLIVGLSLGPGRDWSGDVLAVLGLAVVAFTALGVHQWRLERRGGEPVLPPSVLGMPAMRIGLAMVVIFFVGFGAFMFDFALITQRGHGLSVLESGAALLLCCVAFVVGMRLTPRVVGRFGGPRVLAAAALAQAVLLAVMATISFVGPAGRWSWELWFQVPGTVYGVVLALEFGPLLGVVMDAVPKEIAGLTGGLFSTMQQASVAIGVATLGGLLTTIAATSGFDTAFGVVAVINIAGALGFGAAAVVLGRRSRAQGAAQGA